MTEKYDFDKIYETLMKYEGGYVNDPNDSGSETYKGISRKFYPDSKIWVIIDAHKILNNFENFLDRSPELQKLVYEFYYEMYEKLKINKLLLNLDIKEKVFLSAVNIGHIKAIMLLQRSYNYFKKGKILHEDGILGPISISELNSLHNNDIDQSIILNFYKGELYCYYKNIVEKYKKNLRFFKGWVRRVFE